MYNFFPYTFGGDGEEMYFCRLIEISVKWYEDETGNC